MTKNLTKHPPDYILKITDFNVTVTALEKLLLHVFSMPYL